MAEIKLSPQAVSDINDIVTYIYDDLCNPTAADNVSEKIFKSIELLKDNPEIGRKLILPDDIITDYRVLNADNYLIFYRYESNIYVDRILNGRQDYLRLLFKE